jgi:hypothetical protein
MIDQPNNFITDYSTLQANLYLLATDFESLKKYLAGYTEDGIYNECLEGIREPMAEFPAIIRSGQLPAKVIAKIFECYFLMEEMARYPYPTNNVEAFKNDKGWNKVRQLAKEAADALEDLKKVN